MTFHRDLSFADSLKQIPRREFYDEHKLIAVAMIVIVFLLPVAGIAVGGLMGAISGALISFAAYYLTPYVGMKLRV
jgi:hypothetical protein